LAAQPAGVTLYVQQKDDATRYGKFQTTAEGVDQGDYFAFAVTWVANGAAIVNNQAVAVQFAGGGSGGGGGTGDVVGPASAVDNSVAVYSGTTGKLLKDASQVTVDAATGNLTTPGSMTAGGLSTTPLNASNLSSGTVADARLSSNVPLKNAANTFTQDQRFEKTTPVLKIVNAAATANARIFRLYNSGPQLVFDAVSDDEATQSSYPLQLDRNGDVLCYANIYEKRRTTPMGHWSDVPFNVGNFGVYGGTWTVASGNIQLNRYTLIGTTLSWSLSLSGSSASAMSFPILYLPGPNNGRAGAAVATAMVKLGSTWTPYRVMIDVTPSRVVLNEVSSVTGTFDLYFAATIEIL
jgi:hypothetical protein